MAEKPRAVVKSEEEGFDPTVETRRQADATNRTGAKARQRWWSGLLSRFGPSGPRHEEPLPRSETKLRAFKLAACLLAIVWIFGMAIYARLAVMVKGGSVDAILGSLKEFAIALGVLVAWVTKTIADQRHDASIERIIDKARNGGGGINGGGGEK